MRINGTDGPQRPARPDGGAPEPLAGTKETPRNGPTDRAHFSEEAKRIAELVDAAAGLPEMRAERIRAIRQSIEDGTYRVDARSLAKAILEFEDDLARG